MQTSALEAPDEQFSDDVETPKAQDLFDPSPNKEEAKKIWKKLG